MSTDQPEGLTPLTCPACQGPTPLVEGESTLCQFCQAPVAIPEAYRALRAAELEHSRLVTGARRLYEQLGRPPAWLYRALAGWFSPVSLAVGMFPASFLVGLVLVYGSLWALSLLLPINLLDVTSENAGLWASILTGIAFVWAGTLLGVAGTRRALALGPLQAALAAAPPDRPGGNASCRHCGAALSYGPNELGVRCAYCQCDNLLHIPPAWARRVRRAGLQVGKAIESVETAWLEEQRRLSRFRRVFAMALVVPTVLSWLAFSTQLERGTEPPESWQAATRGEGGVVLYTAHRMGALWYSNLEPVAFRGGAVELSLKTTGPYCSDQLCRVLVRVPAQRGERWTVSCSPSQAPVFVEAHDGITVVAQAWQAQWPGEYGPRVGEGRCGEGLTVEISRTGWHLVGVTLPGGVVDQPVTLSLRRTRP